MRAHNEPVIIWTENGCWYQQTENDVTRSSYLGHIGNPDEVKEWCLLHSVDFTKTFHPFAGTAVAEKWPSS